MTSTYLSGSSNFTVAAEWKTMETSEERRSKSDGLRPRSGSRMSPTTGMTFLWKSGSVSFSIENNWKRKLSDLFKQPKNSQSFIFALLFHHHHHNHNRLHHHHHHLHHYWLFHQLFSNAPIFWKMYKWHRMLNVKIQFNSFSQMGISETDEKPYLTLSQLQPYKKNALIFLNIDAYFYDLW